MGLFAVDVPAPADLAATAQSDNPKCPPVPARPPEGTRLWLRPWLSEADPGLRLKQLALVLDILQAAVLCRGPPFIWMHLLFVYLGTDVTAGQRATAAAPTSASWLLPGCWRPRVFRALLLGFRVGVRYWGTLHLTGAQTGAETVFSRSLLPSLLTSETVHHEYATRPLTSVDLPQRQAGRAGQTRVPVPEDVLLPGHHPSG